MLFLPSLLRNERAAVFLTILLIFSLLASCVDEVLFDGANEALPIISGVISNSPGERTITVALSNGLEPAIPLDASGTLFENGQKARELEVREKGQLFLPMDITLVPGPDYHFEIDIEGRSTYQTKPQRIMPQGRTKELTWKRDRDEFGMNYKGEVIEGPSIRIFATIDVDPNEETFYRWQVSDTWEFREVPIPFVDTTVVIDSTPIGRTNEFTYDTTIIFEPDTAKICYPSRGVDYYPSTIFRTFHVQPGEARVKIMTRELETSFLDKHAFSAYLHRIDQEAYEYYSLNQRLINNDGDIFDETPAYVAGNVYDMEDPKAKVLGYVEMSLADTLRFFITYDDLNYFLLRFCDFPGDACPFISPLARNARPPEYCICWDCEPFFGEGSEERPYFWE